MTRACSRAGWLTALLPVLPAMMLAMLLVGGGAQAQSAAPADAPKPPLLDERFAQAMLAYERCHWQLAWLEFARLGEEGHAEAARVAAQMRRYGRVLYGLEFGEGAPQHAPVRR